MFSFLKTAGISLKTAAGYSTTVSDKREEITGQLYQRLLSDQNLVISPASIILALSMVAIGAGGQTFQQFKQFLKVNDLASLVECSKNLHNDLSTPPKSKGVKTVIANKIYQGIPEVRKEYAELMDKNFSTGSFEKVNFNTNPEEVRVQINAWVSSATSNLITNLLPPGSIGSSSSMVIVNAVYFKGDWLYKFNKQRTIRQPFHLAYENRGKSIDVDMMNINAKFEFYEDNRIQFIQLPYVGGEYIMEIILPKEIEHLDATSNITAALKTARTKKAHVEVSLSLPKFKIRGELISLKDVIKSLGVVDGFSDRADFSFMDPQNVTRMSDVLHKAVIEVNEDGAEAAASTAVTMTLSRSTIKSNEMVCDRPFLFSIRHLKSATTLFLGKFSHPN